MLSLISVPAAKPGDADLRSLSIFIMTEVVAVDETSRETLIRNMETILPIVLSDEAKEQQESGKRESIERYAVKMKTVLLIAKCDELCEILRRRLIE
jgi:hypothetical protein